MTTVAPSPSSYRQIFKATALVGGVQVFNILAGIVKTKVLASVLGPAGIGLVGLYQAATAMVGTVSGMGLTQSGVRQIAEAAATGDQSRISRTVRTLRLTSLLAGLVGMLLVLVFREPLALTTFGHDKYAWGLGALSFTLLFSALAGGQNAILQGLRRIKDLAATQLTGTILGTLLSIGLVVWLRERGIVPFLVVSSAASLVCSWWYARRVRSTPASMTLRETWIESRGLLAMGAAFMVSGLFAAGAAYASRVLVIRGLGMEALGLYTASWTLSNLYVSTVLNAMGADFYPRLTAVAGDNATVNRLVNEQTEMGILIATPGVLLTLALAPWVLSILYSPAFQSAAEVIRWQILGVALRVVSWPLGYIILAKGMSHTYMVTEASIWTLQVLLLALCMSWWGLEGAGVAFALTYVVVLVGYYLIGHVVSGFRWSRSTLTLVVLSTLFSGLVFVLAQTMSHALHVAVPVGFALAASVACIAVLAKMLGGWERDLPGRGLRARLGRSDAQAERSR